MFKASKRAAISSPGTRGEPPDDSSPPSSPSSAQAAAASSPAAGHHYHHRAFCSLATATWFVALLAVLGVGFWLGAQLSMRQQQQQELAVSSSSSSGPPSSALALASGPTAVLVRLREAREMQLQGLIDEVQFDSLRHELLGLPLRHEQNGQQQEGVEQQEPPRSAAQQRPRQQGSVAESNHADGGDDGSRAAAANDPATKAWRGPYSSATLDAAAAAKADAAAEEAMRDHRGMYDPPAYKYARPRTHLASDDQDHDQHQDQDRSRESPPPPRPPVSGKRPSSAGASSSGSGTNNYPTYRGVAFSNSKHPLQGGSILVSSCANKVRR